MDVGRFNNYREYLLHVMEERMERNPRYSLRAFAKSLSLHPSHLSKVLNGKSGLTMDTAARVAEQLEFNDEETSIFFDLVQAVDGRSASARRLASARLHTWRTAPEVQNLQLDSFRIISEWFHFAILELTLVKDFNSDIAWIAKRLGISHMDAKLAIERLKKLDLLIEEDGVLKKSAGTIDINNDFHASAMKKAHKQIIDKAKEAVSEQQPENRALSYMVMPTSKSAIEEARKMIIDFKLKLTKILSQGEREDVYCFSAQLFQLDKNPKDRK